MADCLYCGKPAGAFRHVHPACKANADNIEQKIVGFFSRYPEDTIPTPRFRELIERIALDANMPKGRYREILTRGVGASIRAVLADHELSEAEEYNIINLMAEFNITAPDAGELGHHFYQAMVLRRIKSGLDPDTPFKTMPSQLMLPRGEYIIWRFASARLLSEKKRVQYVGGSSGFSFRVVSGVYYRIGAHKGERIETKSLAGDIAGEATITNRALYVSDSASKTQCVGQSITSDASSKQIPDDRCNCGTHGLGKPAFFYLPTHAVNTHTNIATTL